MSLATPSKIRELQIKLYRKAKNEPGYRFYMLYDKIYRKDILAHAYEQARVNKGAPAVDNYVYESVRHFLRRRHQVQSRGTNRFSIKAVFGELGVLQLSRAKAEPRS